MHRAKRVYVFFLYPSIDICKHDKDPENASECICDALRPSRDAVKYRKTKRTRMCKIYAASLNSFGGEGGSKYGILENVLCKKRNPEYAGNAGRCAELERERLFMLFFVFDWGHVLIHGLRLSRSVVRRTSCSMSLSTKSEC
jgi:hypothetical protein